MNARLYAIYDGSIHDATIATTEEIRKEPCKVRQVKVRLLMLYVETSLREASQSVVNTVNTLNDKTVSAVGRWFRLQTSPLPFAEVKYEHGEAVVILKYDVAKTSRFLGVGLAVIF